MALPGGDSFRVLLLSLAVSIAFGFLAPPLRALDWPPAEALGSANRLESVRAWSRVRHLFVIERLPTESFPRYAAALEEGDCDLAADILWHAFAALEPELARRVRQPAVARRWMETVPHFQFPEYSFCDATQGYAEATAAIRRNAIGVGPETATLGVWIERRNTDRLPFYQGYLIDTLQVLFNVADSDNPEAIRFLLEQDRIGRYLRLTDEQRLLLLLRLARLGHAGPQERAEAARLARPSPIGTVAAARAYAGRAVSPDHERWQAFQARLSALPVKQAGSGRPSGPGR